MILSTTRVPESTSGPITIRPLSLQLREETAELHLYAEQKLGFPDAITNLTEYGSCLESFYRLYRPLEVDLARFSQWAAIGIELAERRHADRLARDLKALGKSPLQLADAPKATLPILPDFSHALGALYVLEGSTLGSQFILRHLTNLLGDKIGAANSFFRGHGEQTIVRWKEFQGSLDLYGVENRAEIPLIVLGAKRTFKAIADWMQP
jgi:heme oxygenase (biliverdin-IX-beta and delta-forming)